VALARPGGRRGGDRRGGGDPAHVAQAGRGEGRRRRDRVARRQHDAARVGLGDQLAHAVAVSEPDADEGEALHVARVQPGHAAAHDLLPFHLADLADLDADQDDVADHEPDDQPHDDPDDQSHDDPDDDPDHGGTDDNGTDHGGTDADQRRDGLGNQVTATTATTSA
jgi:hypothetical protein